MRRVLFLAYHFPPVGGGGVQRSVKFVRYLPELGYEPVVVTGAGPSDDRWTPEDETLAAEIPSGIEIHRVPGPVPPPSAGWRRRAERLLDAPAPFSRWWVEGAVELGRRLGAKVDLVYGGLVPYETAEAAAALASSLGKPWVADLQDPWALDEMWIYPTGIHRRRDLVRMRRLLGSAAAVVMNTPEAARRLVRAFPELGRAKVLSIPNGFDAADFAGPPPRRADGAFRIVHAGTLHSELGGRHRRTRWLRRLLGGAPVPTVDIFTRSHAYLLEAIAGLLEEEPALRSTLQVHLAGVLSAEDRRLAARSPVTRLLGYLPHTETLALLRSADLLFLPMQGLPPGTRAGLVPGKTYEYLASGRPILAAVPDGDARDLLAEAGTARLCRPADTAAMARIVREEIARRCSGTPAARPDPKVLARYERRRLVAELAIVFASVLEGSGASPADTEPGESARDAALPATA
jgi:glycosyltransferase involved in cell wall biosynthesis